MAGLLQDFALAAFIIMLNHWIYGVEDSISYEFIVTFISQKKALIMAMSFLVSVTLLLSSSLFETMGLYKITYGIGKILIRISQFVITFLAILNILFYAALDHNLMVDSGYQLLLSLSIVLCSSVWAIRVIDFNYNSQNALVPTGALAFMSILLVEVVWPFFNF
jgi:hypothetical protein